MKKLLFVILTALFASNGCKKAETIDPCMDQRLLNVNFKFLGLSGSDYFPDWAYEPHFYFKPFPLVGRVETCNNNDIYIRFEKNGKIKGTLCTGDAIEGTHTWSCNGQQKLPVFNIHSPELGQTFTINDSVFIDAFATVEQRWGFKNDTTLFMFYNPYNMTAIMVFGKQ